MRMKNKAKNSPRKPVRQIDFKDAMVRNQTAIERAFPENRELADQQFQRGYEDGVGGFGFRERLADRPELVAAYCYGYILGKFA